jgi:hypothetical protein
MKHAHMLLKLGISLPLLASMTATAQVTVFDAPNEGHFVATVNTLRAELQQVQSMVSAISGLRNLSHTPLTVESSLGALSQTQGIASSLHSLAIQSAAMPCIARNASTWTTCRLDAERTPIEQDVGVALQNLEAPQASALDLLDGGLLASADLKSSTDLSARATMTTSSAEIEHLGIDLFALQVALENDALLKARRADQLNRLMAPTRAIDSLLPPTFGSN